MCPFAKSVIMLFSFFMVLSCCVSFFHGVVMPCVLLPRVVSCRLVHPAADKVSRGFIVAQNESAAQLLSPQPDTRAPISSQVQLGACACLARDGVPCLHLVPNRSCHLVGPGGQHSDPVRARTAAAASSRVYINTPSWAAGVQSLVVPTHHDARYEAIWPEDTSLCLFTQRAFFIDVLPNSMRICFAALLSATTAG